MAISSSDQIGEIDIWDYFLFISINIIGALNGWIYFNMENAKVSLQKQETV